MNHVFSSIICILNKEEDCLNYLQENINIALTWNSHFSLVLSNFVNPECILKMNEELMKYDSKKIEQQISVINTVEEIFDLLKTKNADLLILQGEKDSELGRYYIESFSRQILKRADCSVLIKKNKSSEEYYQHVVLNGFDHPKLGSTLKKAQKIGRSLSLKSMLIMNQRNGSKQTMDYNQENPKYTGNYSIELKEVDKSGFQISELVRSSKANLLIMNTPDTKLGFEGRFLSQELDFLLSDMPSDILLVHSTKTNS